MKVEIPLKKNMGSFSSYIPIEFFKFVKSRKCILITNAVPCEKGNIIEACIKVTTHRTYIQKESNVIADKGTALVFVHGDRLFVEIKSEDEIKDILLDLLGD